MVLASAFTTQSQNPFYVTGGNDDTVAMWDVKDCLSFPAVTRTSHGMYDENITADQKR